MWKILSLSLGGIIGTLSRYYLAGIIYKFTSSSFPWGTLLINLLGSFLIGLSWGITENYILSTETKLFIFIGILGSFTTFSTFSLESFHLLRDGEYLLTIFNILISTLGGILLTFLGYFLTQYFFK